MMVAAFALYWLHNHRSYGRSTPAALSNSLSHLYTPQTQLQTTEASRSMYTVSQKKQDA